MSPRLVLAVLVLMPAVVGCGNSCDTPSTEISCSWLGGAELSGPGDLGLALTMKVDAANSCLSTEGDCTRMPRFSLRENIPSGPAGLVVDVTLPPMQGSATFTLPSPDVAIQPRLPQPGKPSPQFVVVSGALNITNAGSRGFHAEIAMQLQAPEGQTVSITAGQVSVHDCGERQFCPELF